MPARSKPGIGIGSESSSGQVSSLDVRVVGLEVDEMLDYKVTVLKKWVGAEEEQRFDIVLDCVGGKTLEDAWTCVKDGGLVISVAQPPGTKKPTEDARKDVRSVWFIVEPNGQQLGEIVRLVEDGKCKGVVDSVWEIENWEKALERLNGGHTRRKVVLKLAK